MPSCELCAREVSKTSKHHLVPKSRGGKETAELCRTCHSQIHATYTNATLAASLHTIEALREAPELQGYLRWVRKQDDRRLPVRKARDRR